MRLPGHTVKMALAVLYVAAVWVRADGLGDYPYYKDRSATSYRLVSQIADSGSLPTTESRAGWPEGFEPARVQPNGAEYVTGYVYRLARAFTDMSQKKFMRLFLILVFSLCVFSVRRLVWELWRCEAAALIAPLCVALFAPLVLATDGREFVHTPFAALLISLHWVFYFGLVRENGSLTRAVLAALAALALLAVWEGSPLYLLVFGVFAAFGGGLEPRARQRLFALHLAALLLAGVAFPYLRATRFLAGWPWWFFVAATVYVFVRHRLPARAPGPVYFVLAFGALGLLSAPLRGNAIGPLDYWAARLTHPGGRPFEPGALSEVARYLWTHDHAAPIAYTLIDFCLPVLFLLPPALFAMRRFRQESDVFTWQPVGLALAGVGLFLFDRSAVVAASLGLIPLFALAGYGLSQHMKTRFAPVAIGLAVVVLSTTSWGVTGRIAQAGGLVPPGGDGFLRVSIGNADKDLVRHLVSRTSVRDPFLAPADVAPLIVTFAGKTSVLPSMLPMRSVMRRFMKVTHRFYDTEDALYAYCDSLGVRYVLYTVDLLMDDSRYSPRYTLGMRDVPLDAVVQRMHFAPEDLRHFNLVYENDNYRLFRVTEEQEPVFLTDHPIVYQSEIMRRNGDSLSSFYNRIIEILVTYQTAIRAQQRGDEEDAIRRLRYCVEQAPHFTEGWLRVGDSFTRLGEYEAANAAYEKVLAYAPDNERALYYGALTDAHLGNVDEAIGLINILLSVSRDRELVNLAKELKSVIEAGLPLESTVPR